MKNIFSILIFSVLIFGCTGDAPPPGGGCPSTAACGCSNKNKGDCEIDSCCRWTVGQGCDCR